MSDTNLAKTFLNQFVKIIMGFKEHTLIRAGGLIDSGVGWANQLKLMD